jgi:uncharacterized oxidoreductase
MTVTIEAATLETLVADIFHAKGCTREEAASIGHHLVSANLTGHDSHGVIRVARYVSWMEEGFVLPGQSLTIVHETATHAIVDGNFGFGQTIGAQATDFGIAKARASGLAIVGLRRAGHIGRIGDWAERAAAAGLISLHFVNVGGGEIVAPFGGVDRRFATNPVCIGVPAEPEPLILDFATSMVAEGKVLVAANGGPKVPHDALILPDGTLTSDPAALYGELAGTHIRMAGAGEGALRTFGEHKGSGLAFMCEILAACLTGGATSGPVAGGKRAQISNGMLSIYVSPESFAAPGFAGAVRDYAAYVKASRPASPGGEVLLPGEKESRTRKARLRDGIPLQDETWAAIRDTALAAGVTPPDLN